MATEDDWWDYLNHEINVPDYNYTHTYSLSHRQTALKRLVFSWPGGADTSLGQAFLMLERRNEGERITTDH